MAKRVEQQMVGIPRRRRMLHAEGAGKDGPIVAVKKMPKGGGKNNKVEKCDKKKSERKIIEAAEGAESF